MEQIKNAISHSVQNPFFLYIAGKIEYLRKDYEESKRYLIKSYEMDDNIETKNLLALCYYEMEDYAQAKNIFTSILKESENNINVLCWLAKCEKGLGNTDKALEYLEKIKIYKEQTKIII